MTPQMIRLVMSRPVINGTHLLLALSEATPTEVEAFTNALFVQARSPEAQAVWAPIYFEGTVDPSRRVQPPVGLWYVDDVHLPTLLWLGYASHSRWNLVRTWAAERTARMLKPESRRYFSVGRPLVEDTRPHQQLDAHPSISRATPVGFWYGYGGGRDLHAQFTRDNGKSRRETSYLTSFGSVLAIYRRPNKAQPPFLVLRNQENPIGPEDILNHDRDKEFIAKAATERDRQWHTWEKFKKQVEAGNQEHLQNQRVNLEEALF